MTYSERAEHACHPLAKRLFNLMEEKKSNLALAADVTSAEELLQLAYDTGDSIAILKTHIDILQDFTPKTAEALKEAAQKKRFLLFEDRKFADIGNTCREQYSGGLYRISSWADIVNAHPLTGPGSIEALQKEGEPQRRGLLLIAELSSKGNLIDAAYTEKTIALAKAYPHFVLGFISQRRLSDNPGHIHMTPGIGLHSSGDALGQSYITPQEALINRGTDVIIVGRGITHAPSHKPAAETYRQAGWDAYTESTSKVGL